MTTAKRTISGGLALAALAFIGTPLIAAPAYYHDRPSFNAVAPALAFESFESTPYQAETFLIFPDVVLVAEGSAIVWDNGINTHSSDGLYTVGIKTPGTVTFNFLRPITAFGIDVIGFGTIGTSNLSVATENGSETRAAGFSSGSEYNILFAGIIDSAGFTTVRFSGTAPRDSIEFDSLVYDAPQSSPPSSPPAAVPEPGIWALMIVGFGMTGGVLRRRACPAIA